MCNLKGVKEPKEFKVPSSSSTSHFVKTNRSVSFLFLLLFIIIVFHFVLFSPLLFFFIPGPARDELGGNLSVSDPERSTSRKWNGYVRSGFGRTKKYEHLVKSVKVQLSDIEGVLPWRPKNSLDS